MNQFESDQKYLLFLKKIFSPFNAWDSSFSTRGVSGKTIFYFHEYHKTVTTDPDQIKPSRFIEIKIRV